MPRVCAVVHHGGAGTTAAGLLAGKPTFIVPFFGDQPFWGHAVVKAGVGVKPCPIAQLTTEKLREAFVGLIDPALRARALNLRDVMRREDGAGEAVRSFYRHLPTQEMFCDLDHERIATRWSVHDRLKLCDRCAVIVSERPDNASEKMVSYHCVDYTARGPGSTLAGFSSGTGVFWHEIAGASTAFIRQPVKGFSRPGYTGGIVGGIAGLAGAYVVFYMRSLLGIALFVDHVTTGYINEHREEGQRKQSSLLGRHLLAALGSQKGLADTYCFTNGDSVDKLLVPSKRECKRLLHDLTRYERTRYRSIYNKHRDKCESRAKASINLHPTTTAEIATKSRIPTTLESIRLTAFGSVDVETRVPNIEDDFIDKASIAQWREFAAFQHGKALQAQRTNSNTRPLVPSMNICLAAIGTWDNGIKQFAAIGLKLAAHGHRVRLAANECFRPKIVALGLEFYPLAGAPDSVQDCAQLIYNAQLNTEAGRSGFGALQAFRELIYSLWPAAYGSDPHG
ncbi:hypothetical protein L914_21725, partial [Phytophthora nicotianae]